MEYWRPYDGEMEARTIEDYVVCQMEDLECMEMHATECIEYAEKTHKTFATYFIHLTLRELDHIKHNDFSNLQYDGAPICQIRAKYYRRRNRVG